MISTWLAVCGKKVNSASINLGTKHFFHGIKHAVQSNIITGGRMIRCFSSTQEALETGADFTPIYRFPLIVPARAINRLKVYQTVLSVGALPPIALMAHLNYIPMSTCTTASVVGSLACVMLLIMGEFFRKLIGAVYLNARKDTVKVSHLTFWGSRRDELISVSDIVPFSESTGSPRDIYWKVKRYSAPGILYIIVRFGGVVKENDFVEVFGKYDE